jgi:hypothetical protein
MDDILPSMSHTLHCNHRTENIKTPHSICAQHGNQKLLTAQAIFAFNALAATVTTVPLL